MITPIDTLTAIFDTFDKSARSDLQKFIAARPATKWMIAADFCLHDKVRPNNTFVFSLIPYDDYFDVLQEEIRGGIPKDLKKTRDVRASTIALLRDGRRFHIAFVLSEPPAVFSNGLDGASPLTVARESIRLTLAAFDHNRPPLPLRKLHEASKAKAFNTELLADLYLTSYLFGFVSLILAREVQVETLGWFADRDSMVTWCDGVLWHFAVANLHGFAEHFGITMPAGSPVIAGPTPDVIPADAMWYDDLVRIPDYFAGILAAWNFKENTIPADKAKYVELAQKVIADATNLAVIHLYYESGGFSASRRVFSLTAPRVEPL
jgi:hypothetical protein